MRVGWLADGGHIGGAELSQAEFLAAAPEDVEVVSCPPGEVVPDLDRYVIHNCVSYNPEDLEPTGDAPLIRYLHDRWPAGDSWLRDELLERAQLVFTSPLHRDRFPWPYHGKRLLCPIAIDLKPFRAAQNGHRKGAVCIGRMAYGKGTELLSAYSEPVDVYSSVPLRSEGALHFKGALQPNEVPSVLASYERFVFLPTALEPFGRAVVEAWAAGCEVITNRNVGATYWIEDEPEALENASERFWDIVRG